MGIKPIYLSNKTITNLGHHFGISIKTPREASRIVLKYILQE